MSVTKIWKIEGLNVKGTYDNYENVVLSVNYSLTIEIINENPRSRVVYGTVYLAPPAGEFISFQSLTEETVLLWIKTTLGESGVAQVENRAISEVLTMSQPEDWTTPQLPWAAPQDVTG